MAVIQPFQPNSIFTTDDGKLTRDAYDFLNKLYLRVGGGLSSLNAATLETFTWEAPGTIGSTTPSTGAFTSLSVSGHSTLEGVTSTGATGTGAIVFGTSPTLTTPALGTPSAIILTNATGTAASLTAGHVTTNANLTGGVTSVGNAATVVTNANLTGPITSSGNATSVASQTGTGTTFVMDTSPTISGHPSLEGVTSTGATGTGKLVFDTSPVLVTPALGTPSAIILTNASGTAASLTAGHVTTNANLTGVITSVGNATSIASQTGTGTKFVVDTTPTLITPVLGVASGTSLALSGGFGCNGTTIQTAVASGGAAPAGGTGATAGAYDTSAHRDSLITLVNNIRTALVANGIMT